MNSLPDPLLYFKSRFEQHLNFISGLTEERHLLVHKKALFVAIIDALGAFLFPEMDKNENQKRFKKTVIDFGGWPDCQRYSLPHLHQYLKLNRLPHFERVFAQLEERFNWWKTVPARLRRDLVEYIDRPSRNFLSPAVSLRNDVPAEVIEVAIRNAGNRITKVQKNDLWSFQHVALLYKYRNSVLHTFFPPGLRHVPEEKMGPYYNCYMASDDKGENMQWFFDLVYPATFLEELARRILDNTIPRLKEESRDPLEEVARRGYYWDPQLNVDLGYGDTLRTRPKQIDGKNVSWGD